MALLLTVVIVIGSFGTAWAIPVLACWVVAWISDRREQRAENRAYATRQEMR